MEIAILVFFIAIFAGAGLLFLLLGLYWLRKRKRAQAKKEK